MLEYTPICDDAGAGDVDNDIDSAWITGQPQNSHTSHTVKTLAPA